MGRASIESSESKPGGPQNSFFDQPIGSPGERAPVAGSAAFQDLLRNPPALHSGNDFRSGEEATLVNWGCRRETLEFLAQTVSPGSLTIETGAGLSTVVFAMCGANHISVSPSWQEHTRIKGYCLARGIPITTLRQVPRPSEDVLPNLTEIVGARQLDYALIDGAHKFPYPVLDWFFVDRHLKVAGILAIDDVQIPSVKTLYRFLLNEPAYKFERIVGIGTAVFRKLKRVQTTAESDWESQSMNAGYPDWSHLPRLEEVRQRAARVPVLAKAYRMMRGSS